MRLWRSVQALQHSLGSQLPCLEHGAGNSSLLVACMHGQSSPMTCLWELSALRQVVVHLKGVFQSVQALANRLQALGDKVCGALVAKAKHHGRADVKGVALALEVAGAATGDGVPACKESMSI